MTSLDALPTTLNLTMVALRPVWVPYVEGEERKAHAIRAQRTGRTGPNGEAAESGRWMLMLPDGGLYDGPTVSASGLGTAAECMVKWGLDRLDNVPRPENHKADLGGARHDELEAWLKYAKQPYTKGMAQVLSHFPMPGECESEVYFGFLFGRPGHEVVFSGYLDARESVLNDLNYGLKIDDDGVIDMDPRTGRPVVGRMNSTIRDLKTTSSFDWKKTAAQLRADIQACMYGLGEMLRVEYALLQTGVSPAEARERSSLVILKWTYALLKENKDKTCTIRMVETVCETGSTPDPAIANGPNGGVLLTREQAVATVASYLPVAESMLAAIADGKKSKDLGKNGSACASYGGCGWKKIGSLIRIEKRTDAQGKEWEAQVEDVACSPPQGSGFMAQLKQERLRLGIGTEVETGKIGLSGGPSTETGAVGTETRLAKTGEKKMGLGARFGKTGTNAGTNGTNASAKADQNGAQVQTGHVGTSSANGVESKPPPSATQAASATTTAATVAAPSGGGLKSRFAKQTGDAAPKTTTVAATNASSTPNATPKLETKAQVDGMASKADQPGALQPGTPGETLLARLQSLNEKQNDGANAAAIMAAANGAPVNTVVTKVAVGVNPPDAAPEWTAEQQKAEAERLAGVGKAEADKALAEKAKADPSAVARANPEAGAATTTGRGGRRGGRKAVEAQVDAALAAAEKKPTEATTSASTSATSGPIFEDDPALAADFKRGPITVAEAIKRIDEIAHALMVSGHRREAGTIMTMSAALVPAQGAIA